MAEITAAMQRTVNVVPARCGKGKTIHYATAGRDPLGILCGYRSYDGAHPLTADEAAKMDKECTRCIAGVNRLLARAAEASTTEQGPAVHRFATTAEAYGATQSSDDIHDGDVLVIEPEGVVGFLTGAWPVAITAEHGDLHALTISAREVEDGRYAASADTAERIAREIGAALPTNAPAPLDEALTPASADKEAAAGHSRERARYLADYAITRTDDGDRVQRITVTRHGSAEPELTRDLPYEAGLNAARTLEVLGWEITGMETYGGPSLFTAWVTPSPTQNARLATLRVHRKARDFEPVTSHDGDGTVLGYTYQVTDAQNARYGWVTGDGQVGQEVTYLFRGWAEEGVRAPRQVPAPLAPRDVVRDTAPVLLPDEARGIVTRVHAAAQDFRTVEGEHGKLLGYTFQADTTDRTRYGFITMARTFSMALEPTRDDAAAMLPSAVLSDERQAQRPAPAVQRAAALAAQREKATAARAKYRAETDDRSAAEAHRHGATLPPATVGRLAQRAAEQPGPFKAGDRIVCADGRIRTVRAMAPQVGGEPLRVIVEGGAQWIAADCEPAPAETAPARRVLEGTIVQHDGATKGCVPRDVEHPDVLAARRALAGLAAARLTDHHDVSEPTEQERDVRGYMVNPRGQGRVAIYWLEGGEIIRRDTPLHGAALDCLEDRMKREGWETECMGRSAQCLFAHVPDAQCQG
ncbi:hypothetical protein OHA04_27510 [Streptomyces sp. NBC_01590]|uniref:hypothetical protein n=1 Tax=Streptomyces sp. NBC_01590 TaxID=2975887 RepID=UPI0038687953